MKKKVQSHNAQPELLFQQHICDELLKRYKGDTLKYTALEQSEITDQENFIAEDVLWTFVTASQPDEVGRVAHNYGDDTRDEFFKALRSELHRRPMWLIIREGFKVRGVDFKLYFARSRSRESATWEAYRQNRFAFRHHFYFGETNKEIDIVIFLNGLPIVCIELKHEQNQTVSDAVDQYVGRDHSKKIFQHPFAYIAADTTEVKIATDPRKADNFRWHNQDLVNVPKTDGEYPVEFLYDQVLAPENLLEDIAFFLVRAPEKPATETDPARPAFTIYPRFHQERCVKNIAADIQEHFAANGDIGKKYLANHAPGSGKTLTICWLASKLESLYKARTSEKLVETVFIVTAAKSLDKNIKDDIAKFTHLKDKVGLSDKSEDVDDFLHGNLGRKIAPKSIIVTTQQKLAYILDKLKEDPALRTRRVAFLIDEAHRDQDGKRAADMRVPFREVEEDEDAEQEQADIIRAHAGNQMFVAFTATPSQATVDLFGEPCDTYTEAEAIQEGYIVDVASSIVSYKTLYNLHCSYVPTSNEEKEFPKGLVAKALKNIAFSDYGIVQYKAEVMLRYFESEDIGDQLWQRDYWDDLVTGDDEFRGWQKYIRENPANWSSDRYGACTAFTLGDAELLNLPRVAFVASQGFYASELRPRKVWARGDSSMGAASATRVLISTFTSAQEREALRLVAAQLQRAVGEGDAVHVDRRVLGRGVDCKAVCQSKRNLERLNESLVAKQALSFR